MLTGAPKVAFSGLPPARKTTHVSATFRMSTAHLQIVHDCAASVVPWPEAARVARAIQRQVREHFGPAYGVDATVEAVPSGRHDAGAWQVVLVDDAASSNDAGWHELTASGLPLGKVYCKTVIAQTGGWSTTASHEVIELLADPDMSLAVLVYGSRGSRLFAYEVCDPVQDDRYAYGIDRVRVSDFVYPAWFESFRKRGSARFDHAGACDRPLQVLAGGYAQFTHAHYERGWRDEGPARGKRGPARGSRQSRRRIARASWRVSAR
jgi:hypothetical protein